MSFDLSPQIKSILEQEASRAGVSVETLLRRTFTPVALAEDTATRLQNLLTQWQKQYGLPTPPDGARSLVELSAEWATEDAHLTEAERETDRKFWEDFNHGHDTPRLQIQAMTYRYIALDTYPLSNAAVTPALPGTAPTSSEQCHRWMTDCEAAGVQFLVPAIAYYEVVRELYERQAIAKIARLQRYCFHATRFVPLTTEHLTDAAKRWAQLRIEGLPTAGRQALDGDAIFAAQILSLNLPAGELAVVTRNPKHTVRFGLPAANWEDIAP